MQWLREALSTPRARAQPAPGRTEESGPAERRGTPPAKLAAPQCWSMPRAPLHHNEALLNRPVLASSTKRSQGKGSCVTFGTLFVTSFRVLWEPFEEDARDGRVVVPIHAVQSLRREEGGTGEAVASLWLKYSACPALRVTLSDSDFSQALSTLTAASLAAPLCRSDLRADPRRSLAFALPPDSDCREVPSDVGAFELVERPLELTLDPVARYAAWCGHDAEADFARMGVGASAGQGAAGDGGVGSWRLTRANESYALCESYPRVLAVPAVATDVEIALAARFRSGRRLPVLCWKDPRGAASICRSSQPMVGVAQKRSADDERLLQAIADTNPSAGKLHIIDCRPRINAEVNAVKGKGYEHAAAYGMAKLSFASIENIHVMRASLRAFLPLLPPTAAAAGAAGQPAAAVVAASGREGGLEASSWMYHLRHLLHYASAVVHAVSVDRASVLVHCSDGWDRTSQLTALAQLMLDPVFRTRAGFQTLVEKEWLSFGHQMALRCGTVAPLEKGGHAPSDEQVSPIFLQFVDCVWQLGQQFPTAFEFNGTYLAALMGHVLSGEHGTFLCNCERQRVALRLDVHTRSAWADLAAPEYRNERYEPTGDVLRLGASARSLRPWTAFYCRGAGLRRE